MNSMRPLGLTEWGMSFLLWMMFALIVLAAWPTLLLIAMASTLKCAFNKRLTLRSAAGIEGSESK